MRQLNWSDTTEAPSRMRFEAHFVHVATIQYDNGNQQSFFYDPSTALHWSVLAHESGKDMPQWRKGELNANQ